MYLSTSRHPSTLWWSVRMWRAVDTDSYAFMRQSIQIPVTKGFEDRFSEEDISKWAWI